MGIYQRDNINYGGMLGNAMANRMAYAQRDADIQRQMGQNWGNALNQGAQSIAAGLNTWNQQRIDQDKLAQQQQFQAEQRALERANELKRAQEQQKWQAEQNALNRENTYNIAAMNKDLAVQERQAQNVMNYKNAEVGLEYARQAVDAANKSGDINKIAIANRDLQIAQNKYDYYRGLVPFNTDVKPNQDVVNVELLKQMTAEPVKEVQQSQAVKLADLKAIKTLKNEDERNKYLRLIEENPNFGQDKELQEQYIRIKGIKTSAQRSAELKKQDDEFQKMSSLEQDLWLDSHPEFGVLNGHLARKKK